MTSLTIASLIHAYLTDPVSPYHKLRYHTRRNYGSSLLRVANDHGVVDLIDIRPRTIDVWHQEWSKRGVPMAHALMTILRILVNFGVGYLEDPECLRISGILRTKKFPNCKPRDVHLTADMADLIRAEAHRIGLHSVALAQAIQFEGTFRQRDIIGEWVPENELGESNVHSAELGKWMRGIRWEEIDGDLILHHITSKTQKPVHVDFRLAPMVVAELEQTYGAPLTRDSLPLVGPIIINERAERPWINWEFAGIWRKLARAVGIPDKVQNRDSRAGAITEAVACGVPIEDVRKAATHSNIAMTAKYSRGDEDATRRTMTARAAGRAQKAA